MKILFDQGTPAPLRKRLFGHEVSTAYEMGWAEFDNGDLIQQANDAFDVLITTDQNLQHQQDLSGIHLAILVLPTTSWARIDRHASKILQGLASCAPGKILQVDFPD